MKHLTRQIANPHLCCNLRRKGKNKEKEKKEETFELLTCGLSRAEPHQAQLDFLDLPAPRDVSALMAGSRYHGAPGRRVVSFGFLLLMLLSLLVFYLEIRLLQSSRYHRAKVRVVSVGGFHFEVTINYNLVATKTPTQF